MSDKFWELLVLPVDFLYSTVALITIDKNLNWHYCDIEKKGVSLCKPTYYVLPGNTGICIPKYSF